MSIEMSGANMNLQFNFLAISVKRFRLKKNQCFVIAATSIWNESYLNKCNRSFLSVLLELLLKISYNLDLSSSLISNSSWCFEILGKTQPFVTYCVNET